MSTGNARFSRQAASLRAKIACCDYVCSGILARRMLPCGKKNCRCKKEEGALHGPYLYWGRRFKGRLVQKMLSQGQALIVARGIRNYRIIKKILKRWERETVLVIESLREPNR